MHEQIFVPPAHLDSVQSTQGKNAILRHNTLVLSVDGNGIQLAPNQGPLQDLTMDYNYIAGGGWSLRWGVDGGILRHNRFGRDATWGPIVIYSGGNIDESRDNRYADDGTVIGNATNKTLGDRDGDGTGKGNAWGTGYDPKYKLPGN